VRGLLAVVLLCGCNQLFGLKQTAPQQPDAAIDAPPPSDDEDGDGIANELDNCPGIYNPSQDDVDGDLVGDVCDPHPTTKGDHLVEAEYFNGPTTSWTPDVISNWRFDGAGSIVTAATPDATNATITASVISTVTTPTLELGVTVVANSSTQVPRFVETDLEILGDTARCYINTNGATSFTLDELAEIVNGSTPQTGFSGLGPGQSTQWRHTFDGAGATCTFANTSVNHAGTPAASLMGVAVSVAGYTMSIQYALLYDVTP
jgi:hypothetical protein